MKIVYSLNRVVISGNCLTNYNVSSIVLIFFWYSVQQCIPGLLIRNLKGINSVSSMPLSDKGFVNSSSKRFASLGQI